MPAKASGRGRLHLVDEFGDVAGWIAHPEETMRRTGHLLGEGENRWLVDPVDAHGLDDWLAVHGELRGVAVCFNYHRRDAAAIARRHEVPVALPTGMSALSDNDIDAPVTRVGGHLPGTKLELASVVRGPLWQEYRLYDGATLYVPESVGTATYHLAPGESLGVSWLRRARPPRNALDLDPDRLLLGHGSGFDENASERLEAALDGARRRYPALLTDNVTTIPRVFAAAMLE